MSWIDRADAKQWLQIPSANTAQDALIDAMLLASQSIIEDYLGRTIESATYTEYHDGDNSDTILLDVFPIVSVTSVNADVDRVFDSATLLDATTYTFDAKAGTLRRTPKTLWFNAGTQNVKVVYVAGYSAVPEACKQAQRMHVAWLKNRQNTEGFTSQSMGGKSETYEMQLPEYIKGILRPYRKIGA